MIWEGANVHGAESEPALGRGWTQNRALGREEELGSPWALLSPRTDQSPELLSCLQSEKCEPLPLRSCHGINPRVSLLCLWHITSRRVREKWPQSLFQPRQCLELLIPGQEQHRASSCAGKGWSSPSCIPGPCKSGPHH